MDSDPDKRFLELLELARPRELPLTMTAEKCLQLLNEMYQMGNHYSQVNKAVDDERAFMFFLRFITIVVEDLPKHPCSLGMSSIERHSLDIRTLNCISTAEQLKRRIKQRYEKEKEVAAAATDLGGGQSTSTADTSTTNRTPVHKLQHPQQPVASHQAQEMEHLMVPDQQLCPYVRCQAVSMQPIVFQRVIIPNNIPELFLTTEMDNGGGVRFALLYGRLVSKSVIVCQLFPCSLDTISARNFSRFVSDSETGEDLPIVGCICSSLAKACSSGFFRACQISEMVCIVCPPVLNRTILLHLVNMSPSGGSPAHPSSVASSGSPCAHQHITDSIMATMVRKDNILQIQNGTIGAHQGRSPVPTTSSSLEKRTENAPAAEEPTAALAERSGGQQQQL